jgi:hypothetical protein
MPNYVANELKVIGSKTDIQNLLDTIRNTETEKCIDFNKIVPMPKEQEANWYDWSCDNWGTKWNACGTPTLRTADGDEPDTMIAIVKFETAWATPHPVIEKLSNMFPSVNIAVKYADEDAGYNCGVYGFSAGILVVQWKPEKEGGKEAMEHYFSLWNDEENWVYNEETDEYEFKEE